MNQLLLTVVVVTFWIGSSAAEEQRATGAPTAAQTVDKAAPQPKLKRKAKSPAAAGGGDRALFAGDSGTGKTLDVPVRERREQSRGK